MTNNAASSAPPRPIPWLLILGLSSLSLLWPLTALLGLGSGAPRALIIIAIVGVTWIGVVGFGRVPRPVLVLALTGLGHGVIAMIVAVIFGSFGGAAWTVFAALVIDTFWGTVAGLIALAIQQMRKRP